MSKKGRFYIQIKEIFDNGFALGSMQDYVDIMNDLDKQNENKDKQIAELKQQLAEKDKAIESLRKEFSSRLRLIRHPICEEIRRFIRQPENSIFYDVSLYVETAGLEKLLDKLEKGE